MYGSNRRARRTPFLFRHTAYPKGASGRHTVYYRGCTPNACVRVGNPHWQETSRDATVTRGSSIQARLVVPLPRYESQRQKTNRAFLNPITTASTLLGINYLEKVQYTFDKRVED